VRDVVSNVWVKLLYVVPVHVKKYEYPGDVYGIKRPRMPSWDKQKFTLPYVVGPHAVGADQDPPVVKDPAVYRINVG